MSRFPSLWSRLAPRTAPARRPRLRLEAFEDRTVPATVNGSVSGGTLFLTAVDPASAEEINIRNGPLAGQVTVEGVGGTDIKFGPVTQTTQFFSGVKSVVVSLQGGDDIIHLQGLRLSGSVSLDGGDGFNQYFLEQDPVTNANPAIGGSLNITGAAGDDQVNFNAQTSIGKSLSVNLGNSVGSNLLRMNVNPVYVGGALSYTGTAGVDDVRIGGAATIGQGVSASLGDGDNSFQLGGAVVGKGVTVNAGKGADSIVVAGNIGAGVGVSAGDGANIVQVAGFVSQGVNVTTGRDADAVTVAGFIGGNVTVGLGDGANNFTANGFIGQNLGVTAGINDDSATFGGQIGGNLNVSVGNGSNTVTVDGTVGLNASITTGKDADNVKIGTNTSAIIGGNLTVNTGDGVDDLSLQSSTVSGGVNLNLGAGDDDGHLFDLTVSGGVSINLGAGNNTLDLDSNTGGAAATGSILFGTLSVTGSTGTDNVTIGNEKPVYVGGAANFNMGSEASGSETLSIDDTTFDDAVTINMGDGLGTDILLLDTTANGNNVKTQFNDHATINMGSGDDSVTLGDPAAPTDTYVSFAVLPSINGGPGLDTLIRGNGDIGGKLLVDPTVQSAYKNFETVI